MSLSRLSSAADRTTYLASRRKGSSVGCSPRTVRLLVRALAEDPGGAVQKPGALKPETGAAPSRVTALPPLKNSASRKEIDRDDAQQIHS